MTVTIERTGQLIGQLVGWEWRQLFVESLLTLAPTMNPDAADEISDSQFALLSAVPANEAAERYVRRSAVPGRLHAAEPSWKN